MSMVWNFLKTSVDRCLRFWRRLRLHNRNFSLFSNDCTGGVILHQLGECFNSPTVNLFFEKPIEYVAFLEHVDEYCKLPIEFVKTVELTDGKCYPVGVIHHKEFGDIIVHFMHYSSFNDAITYWKRRCGRIHVENAFALLHMSKWESDSQEVLNRFAVLPFRGKCLITWHGVLPEKACWKGTTYIPPSSLTYRHGLLLEWKNRWRQKHIDDFDYINFLNGEK